jgi:hypothetical protein
MGRPAQLAPATTKAISMADDTAPLPDKNWKSVCNFMIQFMAGPAG